jgi:HK97 family phage portal protein
LRLFGLEITRSKAAPPEGLSSASGWGSGGLGGGWYPIIREPFAGAWQRNEEVRVDTALSNATLFRCVSLIASDMAKMCVRLMAEDSNGIWTETFAAAFSPVLRKPNHYQNRIQFVAEWMTSKLLHGNTYVLKERDNRNVVVAMYVLNPLRVRPMIAPSGDVYYSLSSDYLSQIGQAEVVPASEIIHDRMNTIFHPLVGVSPIYACGLAALQGIEIQRNSTSFFRNGARPGGVLTAPARISEEVATRLKEHWEQNYTGENAGRVAVLGDGLKFEAMATSAVDSELINQLKWTSEQICTAFGVPAYMVGVGPAPLNNNVESLLSQYYSQCLQIHIESMEAGLDEGLGLGSQFGNPYGTEFDLDDLLRMDSASLVKMLTDGLKGVYSSNEARKRMNLPPVEGGDAVLSQQQNFSLEALAKRDAQDDPFAHSTPAAPALPAPAAEPPPAANDTTTAAAALVGLQAKFMQEPAACLTSPS